MYRDSSGGKRNTVQKKRDSDPNYGPVSGNPRIQTGQSALVGSMPSYSNPYDVIETRDDNSALDASGCVTADETINVNQVKSFKQRNDRKLDQRKSPDPSKGQKL